MHVFVTMINGNICVVMRTPTPRMRPSKLDHNGKRRSATAGSTCRIGQGKRKFILVEETEFLLLQHRPESL